MQMYIYFHSVCFQDIAYKLDMSYGMLGSLFRSGKYSQSGEEQRFMMHCCGGCVMCCIAHDKRECALSWFFVCFFFLLLFFVSDGCGFF